MADKVSTAAINKLFRLFISYLCSITHPIKPNREKNFGDGSEPLFATSLLHFRTFIAYRQRPGAADVPSLANCADSDPGGPAVLNAERRWWEHQRYISVPDKAVKLPNSK